MPQKIFEMSLPPKDYESITVSNTAIGLTAGKIGVGAFLTVETDAIRYRIDGTDPTSSEGHQVASGGTIYLADKVSCEQLKMIRVTTDATVKVTHYG